MIEVGLCIKAVSFVSPAWWPGAMLCPPKWPLLPTPVTRKKSPEDMLSGLIWGRFFCDKLEEKIAGLFSWGYKFFSF